VDELGYIYLADFGLSKFLQSQVQTYSFCGTAEYLAPEILDQRGHGFAVDWWTFGVLVYEMATGRPPFMHKNHMQLGNLIRHGNIIFPDPERHKIYMSELLKDFITKLLDRNASTRLGSKGGVNEVISHPFFQGMDFTAL
jgi:serine/threonine protein kinase